ncbi:MAG: carbohydrate-binding module family 20 domain-containing protein [Bacteroidota bacterium]
MKKEFLAKKAVCKVTFTVPAEAVVNAQSVTILGDFNDWDPRQGIEMKKAADQSFSATVELSLGKNYQFRYLVDGAHWINDWAADAYWPSPYHGIENSVILLESAPEVPASSGNGAKVKSAKPAKPKKRGKSKEDRLAKVEGIGPKIEGLLRAEGITSFKSLSETSVDRLKEILIAAGSRYKMFDPTTWPEQSKLAADGKWEELKALQDKLKAGKRV